MLTLTLTTYAALSSSPSSLDLLEISALLTRLAIPHTVLPQSVLATVTTKQRQQWSIHSDELDYNVLAIEHP